MSPILELYTVIDKPSDRVRFPEYQDHPPSPEPSNIAANNPRVCWELPLSVVFNPPFFALTAHPPNKPVRFLRFPKSVLQSPPWTHEDLGRHTNNAVLHDHHDHLTQDTAEWEAWAKGWPAESTLRPSTRVGMNLQTACNSRGMTHPHVTPWGPFTRSTNYHTSYGSVVFA